MVMTEIPEDESAAPPPSNGDEVASPLPCHIDIGHLDTGSFRVRCLFDPDWGSVILLRTARDKPSEYFGSMVAADTATPRLYLTGPESWRLPTPEAREELRQDLIALLGDWREKQQADRR
jgi:hypothetical protein